MNTTSNIYKPKQPSNINILSVYKQCGFIQNEDLINKIFNLSQFKEIYIDVYIDRPYMLYLRTKEKNVLIDTSIENSIIFTKNDRSKTVVLNILKNEIEDGMIKKYTDNKYEIIFGIRDIRYKIYVVV